jgi:hypothetical protein
MKKQLKKLVLAKETVRSLGETDLAAPEGGVASYGTPCFVTGTCNCTGTCNSCISCTCP